MELCLTMFGTMFGTSATNVTMPLLRQAIVKFENIRNVLKCLLGVIELRILNKIIVLTDNILSKSDNCIKCLFALNR